MLRARSPTRPHRTLKIHSLACKKFIVDPIAGPQLSRSTRIISSEQQIATAEVLGVINSSPDDVAPVFDSILSKALNLCDAAHGHVFRIDGEGVRAVAARGAPDFVEWLLKPREPVQPVHGGMVYRMMRGKASFKRPILRTPRTVSAAPPTRSRLDRLPAPSPCRQTRSVPRLHTESTKSDFVNGLLSRARSDRTEKLRYPRRGVDDKNRRANYTDSGVAVEREAHHRIGGEH